MEIKSFILPVDRQYFLNYLEKEKYYLKQRAVSPIDFIAFTLEDWLVSHNQNLSVALDDVKLPEVKEIKGESIEEKIKRQIEALPTEVLFKFQILLKEGMADRCFVSLYDVESELDECLKLLEPLSSKEAMIRIFDKDLADFVSKLKDKRQSLKRWVKDYLENEYPNLRFTVENEGSLLSSTQVIKEYLDLSEYPIVWSWKIHVIKDDKGAWNIFRMYH